MTRTTLALLVWLALSAPARAEAKPAYETWQAAYFEGLKVGHQHTVVRQVKEGGATFFRTTRVVELVIKRYGSVIPLHVETTCDETAYGKVLALAVTQRIARDKKATQSAKVHNGKLLYSAASLPRAVELPWDDRAIGAYAQELYFQKNKAKKGDKAVLYSYELLLPGTITLRCAVKDDESVDQLVAKQEGGKLKVAREAVKLLRVEVAPDAVKVGTTTVELPKKVFWLDAKGLPVREQFDMPGLGAITLYNTTKDAALKEGVAPELLPDLGLNISVPVARALDEPYKVNEARYKVTLKEEIKDLFTTDARQEVKNAKGKTFDLVVTAIRAPAKGHKGEAGKEYTESNHFIDSDDAGVRKLAAKVVGGETGAWKKAQRLEKWVRDNMKSRNDVGFPTAAAIARDREGDCRQHALLLVALCRAAGVPARTAVGLLYWREPGKSPLFAFHMWAEVHVEGQWLGLDATLGQGGIGATHLKMGDHSWAKTQTLAPLLPIARALGKVQIEIDAAR